ncbi:MAG: ribonuclease P protein component [Candidatus Eisenbacteria bacterium]
MKLLQERKVRQTLRRSERLRQRKDFDRLFRQSRVARGEDFRVHYFHRDPAGPIPARAAFVAGRRIGNSVTRNRIKRLLREAFRRIKKDLNPAPIDLVFVANRDFSGRSSGEVTDRMRELMAKIGALAESGASGDGPAT